LLQQSEFFVQARWLKGMQQFPYIPQYVVQHCLVSWPRCVHRPPIGVQVDCSVIGRAIDAKAPTVSITSTAKFLKMRKRDIVFLLVKRSVIWTFVLFTSAQPLQMLWSP